MNRILLAGIALVIFGVGAVTGIVIGSGGRTGLGQTLASGAVEPTADVALLTTTPATPPATPPAAPLPTPSGAPTAAVAAPQASVPQPAPAGAAVPRDYVLELAESDLNQGLQTILVGQPLGMTPLGEATVTSIEVALRNGLMYVDGDATIGTVTAPFAVVSKIEPDSAGHPRVTLTSAQIANLIMPPPVVTGLSNVLQQQIDQVFAPQTMRVRSVEITDGRIRVVATQ